MRKRARKGRRFRSNGVQNRRFWRAFGDFPRDGKVTRVPSMALPCSRGAPASGEAGTNSDNLLSRGPHLRCTPLHSPEQVVRLGSCSHLWALRPMPRVTFSPMRKSPKNLPEGAIPSGYSPWGHYHPPSGGKRRPPQKGVQLRAVCKKQNTCRATD